MYILAFRTEAVVIWPSIKYIMSVSRGNGGSVRTHIYHTYDIFVGLCVCVCAIG